jgi:hypothetical protein
MIMIMMMYKTKGSHCEVNNSIIWLQCVMSHHVNQQNYSLKKSLNHMKNRWVKSDTFNVCLDLLQLARLHCAGWGETVSVWYTGHFGPQTWKEQSVRTGSRNRPTQTKLSPTVTSPPQTPHDLNRCRDSATEMTSAWLNTWV